MPLENFITVIGAGAAIAIAVALVGGLIWLTFLLFLDFLELRNVRRTLDDMSESDRNLIYSLIENLGSAPSRGCIGIFGYKLKSNGNLSFRLPSDIQDFPWNNKNIKITSNSEYLNDIKIMIIQDKHFEFDETNFQNVRWISIPSIFVGKKKQRVQSVLSIDRYLRMSNYLNDKITKLYPSNPKLLLEKMLAPSGWNRSSEPSDQLRSGLSAAWVQQSRFHQCPTCRRPMRLILQIPGELIASRVGEGTFYLFGCPSHPDQTIQDDDWG